MQICLAQINPRLGDFEYNFLLILECINNQTNGNKCDFIIFPENCLGGYNPQDLVLRKDFVAKHLLYLGKIAEYTKNINVILIIGSVRENEGKVYNSVFAIQEGCITHLHDKIALPNYGVFDEKRTFASGKKITLHQLKGIKFCAIICEDIWDQQVCNELITLKPEYIFCINGSPFTKTKEALRIEIVKNLAIDAKAYVVYVNQVGLQDSLIYDGASFAVDFAGRIICQAPSFRESNVSFNINNNIIQLLSNNKNTLRDIYHALVFALREYAHKNNMKEVIIGFSSGIDSAITSIIAFDAIGKDNVHLYMLPTRFNKEQTHKDAEDFCILNDARSNMIGIDDLYDKFSHAIGLTSLDEIALQNLQSRIRGVILMALANQKKYLLLATSNKSELAVGYATLYGDMNGGYNLLKDLYKSEIYQLAEWRNKNIPENSLHNIESPIPANIISKAPTAELAEGQKDVDTLPDYNILDAILTNYIDYSRSSYEIKEMGLDAEIVDYILNLIRISQFKRYQSTMGPKISDMSFDMDWRYPIMNFYNEKK
ncbi:MAG: NAD+ synthase [Alphaproteobacteria bacterium]|nr:NAD+ synthase [Alphaproteobacteria bacterium]